MGSGTNVEDTRSSNIEQVLTFTLNQDIFAIPLRNVIRVIQIIEIKKLPDTPLFVAGIISIGQQIIPVIDLRKRLSLTGKGIDFTDHLIISDTGKRIIALWVDSVNEIQKTDQKQFYESGKVLPFSRFVKGITRLNNDFILIYDLEQFINTEENEELEKALANNQE